jgi:hypothetical protein
MQTFQSNYGFPETPDVQEEEVLTEDDEIANTFLLKNPQNEDSKNLASQRNKQLNKLGQLSK